MEWIQRNPKASVALAALTVLLLVVLVWGASRSGPSPDDQPTLGAPSTLATPTAQPSRKLTALPTPSGTPTSLSQVVSGFPSAGMGSAQGMEGSGATKGLKPHTVVIKAGSDGPLLGVGWYIPTADGARTGTDTSRRNSYQHAVTAYGNPDYAQLYTYVGPASSTLWCTVTVDGRVTEHQEAKGPWAQVFCQG